MFVIQHPRNFRTPGAPIFLCLFHFIVNFANEIIMLSSIMHNDDIMELLKMAEIFIVSEIPMLYFEAIDDDLKHKMPHSLKAKTDIWTI